MENNPFIALLLITGLALVVPILTSRVRRISLPIVVGEILAGFPLRRIRLPGNALILSLQHDSTVIVPHGDTRLELDDVIGLIGSSAALERARAMLSG